MEKGKCFRCLHNDGRGRMDSNNEDCLMCTDYSNFRDLWYANEFERDERNARLERAYQKRSITIQLKTNDIDKFTEISNELCLSDADTMHFLIRFYLEVTKLWANR